MLDYETRKQTYQRTPEDVAWRLRRIAYYFGHVLLFAAIVWRVGPNLFLFGSPFTPPPAHYAPLTHEYVPLVAGIKAYQRDNGGKLPFDPYQLPRGYVPAGYQGQHGAMLGTPTLTFMVSNYAVLAYDFRPASEGWFVYAPRYYGPVPAPLVQAAASPASRPSTARGGNG
jgi:hypothetical protein